MKNLVWERSSGYFVKRVTVASTIIAGDPVEIVDLHGVAVTSYDAADGKADVAFSGFDFVADLSVKGENAAGNVAVAIGDKLYYEAAQTPPINKDATNGKFFGYALETISSGATDTINVACAN